MEFDDSSQHGSDLGFTSVNDSENLVVASVHGSPKKSPKATSTTDTINASETQPKPVKRKAKKLQGLSDQEAEIKRIRSNEQERVRQKTMTAAFSLLHSLLPENPDAAHKKGSKAFTLETAIDYINALQQLIADHDSYALGLNKHQFENQYPKHSTKTGHSYLMAHIKEGQTIPCNDQTLRSASNDALYKRGVLTHSPYFLGMTQDNAELSNAPAHTGFMSTAHHVIQPEYTETCLPTNFQHPTLMPLTRQLQNVSTTGTLQTGIHHQELPKAQNFGQQCPVSPNTVTTRVVTDADIQSLPGNKENGMLPQSIPAYPNCQDSSSYLHPAKTTNGHCTKPFETYASNQRPHIPRKVWRYRYSQTCNKSHRFKTTHPSQCTETTRSSQSPLFSPQNSSDSLRTRTHPYFCSEISPATYVEPPVFLPALTSSIDSAQSDEFSFLPPSPKFPPEEMDFSSHCPVSDLDKKYSTSSSGVNSFSVPYESWEDVSKDKILSTTDTTSVPSNKGFSNFIHSTPQPERSLLFDNVFGTRHTPINGTPLGHISSISFIANSTEDFSDNLSGYNSITGRQNNFSSSDSSGYLSSEQCQSHSGVKSHSNSSDGINQIFCDLTAVTDRKAAAGPPRKLNFNS